MPWVLYMSIEVKSVKGPGQVWVSKALHKIRVRSTTALQDKLTPSHYKKREDRPEGKMRSLRFPPSLLRRILSQTSQRGNL